jgi:plasmid stabilization system protein ParE
VEYISERSDQNAVRIFDQILEAMEKLAEMPGMGHRREDITDRPVRFWSVHSFLIVYDPATKRLKILHIVHGARNLRGLVP